MARLTEVRITVFFIHPLRTMIEFEDVQPDS